MNNTIRSHACNEGTHDKASIILYSASLGSLPIIYDLIAFSKLDTEKREGSRRAFFFFSVRNDAITWSIICGSDALLNPVILKGDKN